MTAMIEELLPICRSIRATGCGPACSLNDAQENRDIVAYDFSGDLGPVFS